MARRRGAPSVNTLSPPDSGVPAQSSGILNFPRSASPSAGFTQFLSKPTKWFNRSHSSGHVPSRSSTSTEPRSSTSSRKPKISHPTDPRPILDTLRPEPSFANQGGSRSVLDLSLARTATNFDHAPPSSRIPSSPSQSSFSKGLGDLRNISRKAWSRSADDLGKLSHSGSPTLAPIDTSFQEKIDQYRNLRNDSFSSITGASPTTSPAASLQAGKHFPFPAISTSDSLSSSPPPRLTHSGSGSSPNSTNSPPLTPASGQVHTRSHSFTPRLPSKLSVPKLGNLVPPSPTRKNSGSSEHSLAVSRDTDKDRISPSSSLNPHSASRSAFPFNLGGSKSISPSDIGPSGSSDNVSSSTLLAPPTIIEPGDEGSRNQKRTSQVIYHSGFINRLADFSPAALNARANHAYMSGNGAPALAKGWKPFKLVLKGSKLYFYKPPSDRSAAVKELFPTELVVVLEDEGLNAEVEESTEPEVETNFRGGKGKEKDGRRRAYWGRGTHPSLVVDGEAIERGTFEALVHEAVFATTFMNTPEADSGSAGDASSATSERYRPEWKDFASTVLLCVPFLVGRARFEAEFIRCTSMLTEGAEDKCKEEEQSRVRWLAEQYLEYHRSPADEESWKKWWSKTSPTVPYVAANLLESSLPPSSSVQGLYTPSPHLTESPKKVATELSPNLGTFSPRPNQKDGRMMSLIDALSDTRPLGGASNKKQATSLRDTLDRMGLTRDVLLTLDAQVVARALFLHNQRALQNLPNRIDAQICFEPFSRDTSDTQSEDPAGGASSVLKPFVGTEEHPHWLTKAILLQVLISDNPGRASMSNRSGRSSTDLNSMTSRTHSRSEVISAWARIGELSRRTGDECSFRAIYSALCSRPIARLDKAWKRVDSEAMRAVQSWVHGHDGSPPVGVSEPKQVPWAGERIAGIKSALEEAKAGEENEWKVAPLAHARSLFEALQADFSSASRAADSSATTATAESDEVEALIQHCEYLATGGSAVAVASKFTRIDQFMSLSLAAEPRKKGSFEPYFWTRPTTHTGFHPLTPLLFPELLPTISFLDRSLLARGRVESNASTVNVQDIHYLRELKPLSNESRHNSELSKLNGLDLKGTIIVLYDGGLTLLVQPASEPMPASQPSSRAPSRPPSSVVDPPTPEKTFSRAPSVRVKPGSSHGLDRKPSQIRRNSLPSLSKKPSFIATDVAQERPLRVVVQAGTLDRLVDVLVEGLHGVSVSVADDNGEMPLNNGRTRELKVDLDEYSTVWWSVFRSFVTPLVFFELLRKRYNSAGRSADPEENTTVMVVRRRSQIFDTLTRWITQGNGAQDALDDSQLYNSMKTFLTDEHVHELPEGVVKTDHAWALLEEQRCALLELFTTQTLRSSPSKSSGSSESSSRRRSHIHSFGSDPPNIDKIDPEELVSNLDAMASATFRNVVQEDLFVTADILEVQSADRTGWFPAREPSVLADEIEIQCIQSYLHEVEPSPMISELGQDSIYRMLPPAVRGCIRAFGILRKWLIHHIVGPKIDLRVRQKRMELLLRALEVCRIRSVDPGSEEPPASRPCIRSFVEAVLTSAIVSVESRMYAKAWQAVATARRTQCETLASYLSRPAIQTVNDHSPLTMDLGWLLEKILEVISMPDVLDSVGQEGLSLVNFDKRRTLYGLITNSVSPGLPTKAHHRYESCRQDFERLNNIEHELSSVVFDWRTLREHAHKEATYAAATGAVPMGRRGPRPFASIVSAQQEKNKRDRVLRDRLSREKRQEQQRHDKREEFFNKAMHTRRPAPSTPKSHRNKKSMSSAFLHFMRPISSAFSSDSLSTGPKRTPAELDFTPTGKPSLVLSMADARVTQFINTERSFTFQIDTEDGGHYLLQALDKADMKKWMDTIDQVSKMAAKRRLTYLGHNSKMQMSDHLVNPGSVSRDPRAVFGVELEFLLRREAGSDDIPPGAIPSVIERLMTEVDTRGLTEIGIYRVAGAHSEVTSLKEALNRGEWPIDQYTDVNAVCDLIKAWFRVLPDGMFPGEHYTNILAAAGNESIDLETRLSNIRRVVHSLPQTRFDLLKRLMEHLDRVTDFEEQNQMTAESLSTVFSPNLLRSSNNDIGSFFANMSAAHRAVKMLITHFHTIFDDAEPEAEPDLPSDHEEYEQFDEPIPEEDEEEDDILSASHELSEDDGDDSTSAKPRESKRPPENEEGQERPQTAS
ncbi:hypothetical protein K474DRAFT_1499666 [Panus rudis PR-1116 ss-1]|nr:hypothetical protein K474DRAFT_1499666 [Panus rudis PR-1116 ss-1]